MIEPEKYIPNLDVVPATEKLHRRVYDAAVEIVFTPSTLDQDEVLPGYGPDDCGFQVVLLLGRWFAYWKDLEAAPRRRAAPLPPVAACPNQ